MHKMSLARRNSERLFREYLKRVIVNEVMGIGAITLQRKCLLSELFFDFSNIFLGAIADFSEVIKTNP